MKSTSHILVIGEQESLPASLQQALAEAPFDQRYCSISEALEDLQSGHGVEAVLLALADQAQAQLDQVQALVEQLEPSGVSLLMLTGDRDKSIPVSGTQGRVINIDANESAEMIKGRLATLIELQPVLQAMQSETRQLNQINRPINNYMNEVDEEMRLAARLQHDFLPQKLPEIEQLTFATIYRPATWVSGDIYDIMRLDEKHIGFYVADAVGHGMPAALLTMFIKRAIVTKRIKGHHYELIEPHEVLGKLNADLVEQNLTNFQFATCGYAILNIETLELRLASAGHPLPIVIDEQAQTRELHAGGSLLGVFGDAVYTTETYRLEPEQKLLLFSDGVELAFVNEGPDEPLRFRQEFGDLSHYDIHTMCDKLLEVINDEEGSLHPRDDVTIVGLEIKVNRG